MCDISASKFAILSSCFNILALFSSLFFEVIFSYLTPEPLLSISLGSSAETLSPPVQSANNAISLESTRAKSHPRCFTDLTSDSFYLTKRWQKFKIIFKQLTISGNSWAYIKSNSANLDSFLDCILRQGSNENHVQAVTRKSFENN